MNGKRAILTAAGALATLVISAGCSSGESATQHSAEHGSTGSTSAGVAPSSHDHNDADVTFAQHMIPHHRQAVEMSDVVLAVHGIDPRVAELANSIKAAQGPEINQMQGWLDQWANPPMPPMTSSEGHDMGGMSGDAMGMMSDEQMTELKNAKGVEASRLFLTGMITHHEGAITMAENEIEDGRFPPAVELARTITTTQRQEIDTMRGVLETL